MTSFSDAQEFESFVPVYDVVPEKWEEARPFLVETLKKITNAVNTREIGFFLDQELLAGKQFIPGANIVANGGSNQQFRTVLRKVIDFGQLPNTGLKGVLHGINVDANFTLVQMYGAATDPVSLVSFPLPLDSAGTKTGVALFMNATQVLILTESNRSTFTRCFITVEYIMEL